MISTPTSDAMCCEVTTIPFSAVTGSLVKAKAVEVIENASVKRTVSRVIVIGSSSLMGGSAPDFKRDQTTRLLPHFACQHFEPLRCSFQPSGKLVFHRPRLGLRGALSLAQT